MATVSPVDIHQWSLIFMVDLTLGAFRLLDEGLYFHPSGLTMYNRI